MRRAGRRTRPSRNTRGRTRRAMSRRLVTRDKEAEERVDEPMLDAVLTGHIIMEHPDTSEITPDWLAEPRWREALTVLRRAQRGGQRLGDLMTAGRVLAHAAGGAVYLPWTTAAEAVCAAYETPLAAVMGAARERAVRFALQEFAAFLTYVAALAPAPMIAALPTLRTRLTAIETFVADVDPHFSIIAEPVVVLHRRRGIA